MRGEMMNVINQALGERFALYQGDCTDVLRGIPDATVDLSVFSPPFLSLYTYTASDRDLGNCASEQEFSEHFGYTVSELLRVTMPGRNCCVHTADVAAMLS